MLERSQKYVSNASSHASYCDITTPDSGDQNIISKMKQQKRSVTSHNELFEFINAKLNEPKMQTIVMFISDVERTFIFINANNVNFVSFFKSKNRNESLYRIRCVILIYNSRIEFLYT